MSLKVGVLLPTSRMFPGVDQGFLAGLEGALAGVDPRARLIVEPVGAGANRDVVQEKIQKLLLVERPHVVVGVLGAGLVPHVQTSFAQHRTPFLVCNLGADLLLTGDEPNPFIFWNSLNVWQSTYALGFWASRNVGRTGAIAAAFHEAGYGIVRAFWLGFEMAGGGRVLATEVTHRASATEDPSDALARLAAHGPDLVFGLYAGREGVSFMRAWAALGLTNGPPLVTTPLMTHGHWLGQMGPEVLGVRTACSWVPGTDPAADARFSEACGGAATRPAPDVFGLLGYEAGLIVRGALTRLGTAPVDGAALGAAMAGVGFASPRGEMRVDADSREVPTSDQLIEIRSGASEEPAWTGVGRIRLPDRYDADARIVRDQEVKPGWVNAYLVN